MYNLERKKTYFNFLNSIKENSAYSIEYIFKRLSPIEEMWNKDICDFTYDEICKVLALFNASSLGSLRKNLSVLKTYTDWCCQNRLSIDNINHYVEIDTSKIDIYVNKATSGFITRNELNELLIKLPNDSDKFLILALFEGVRSEFIGELLAITLNDIDHEKKTITFPSGETKVMSRELYYLAIKSSEEEIYYSLAEHTEIKLKTGKIVNERVNATKDSIEHLNKRIKVRISLIKEVYGVANLSIPKLSRAGLIDNIRKIMAEKNITKEEFFSLRFKEYCKELNPNYEIGLHNKVNIKMAIYKFI